MEAAQALRELMELSSQITSAVVLERTGRCSRSSLRGPGGGRPRSTASTLELVAAASELGREGREVTRVEVELEEGAFFVVREGGRTVASGDGAESDLGSRRLRPADLRSGHRRAGAEEAASRSRKKESTE